MNTEARIVALEHALAESDRERDRIYDALWRLLLVVDVPERDRDRLLEALGVHPDVKPVEPR